MCAAVAKTSREAIILAARALLERGGPDAVTMQELGRSLGIRAPSLYKKFSDRVALLRVLQATIMRELEQELDAAPEGEPAQVLAGMAQVYRDYAHRHPAAYQMVFGGPEDDEVTRAARAALSRRLLLQAAKLVGEHDALSAARTLIAFLHGFVAMELADAFRLGDRVEQAYDFGLQAVLRGIISIRPAPRRKRS